MHGLHAKHGVTDSEVLRAPDDANDITIIHRFATAAAANELANDPDLKAAMMISNYLKQVKGTLNDPSIYAYSGLTKMTVRSSGACASELTQVHRP